MRARLLFASSALMITQLVHTADALLRGGAAGGGPEAIGAPVGLVALIANIVAIIAVAAGWRWAKGFVFYLGALIGLGFVVYHGFPGDLRFNNPYWGRGDLLQWLTAIGVVAASAACVWVAMPGTKSDAVFGDDR